MPPGRTVRGWARTTATSAKQSPPSAIATTRSSTVLPGSCTDRAGRHGLNARERPPSQAADRGGLKQQGRPAERDQRLAAGFDTNTYTTAVTSSPTECLSAGGPGPLTSPSFPCWTGTSVHHAPNKPRSHERSRLVIGGSRRNSKPATMRVRLCGNAPYAGTRVHTRKTRVVRYSCVSVLPAIPSPVRMSTTRGDRRGLVTLGSKEYAKCPTSESSVVSRQ